MKKDKHIKISVEKTHWKRELGRLRRRNDNIKMDKKCEIKLGQNFTIIPATKKKMVS